MFRRLIPLAVIGASALAASASAQMGPPPMMMGGDMMFHRELGPPSPEMEKMMAEHRAQMAKDMHTILRLRPDQEAAWTAFEAAHAPFIRRLEPPKGPPATTPERLDMMKRHMDEMAAQEAKADAATRAFYAALSPEQQQVFDALERMRGPHGPGGGPRMMMIRHDGGPPHE